MDPSFEKAERSRAGTQVAVWNEAHSWLGPLREYARISTAIRPGLRIDFRADLGNEPARTSNGADSIERRLLFLGWEIQTLIAKHRPEFPSALALLNSLFFGNLEFHICDELGLKKLDGNAALLESVLARRNGPTTLVSVLYAWIGESIAQTYGDDSDFARIELVQGCPHHVVRVIAREDRGEVWLLDLAKRGERVNEDHWSIWCASAAANGFSRLSWVQGLVRSLTELFRLLEKMPTVTLDMLSAQLFVLDQIITLQPSETSRWAERAMINTRRGDRSGALDDLKRFFAFHERETAPAAIVSLFDDLRGDARGHDLN